MKNGLLSKYYIFCLTVFLIVGIPISLPIGFSLYKIFKDKQLGINTNLSSTGVTIGSILLMLGGLCFVATLAMFLIMLYQKLGSGLILVFTIFPAFGLTVLAIITLEISQYKYRTSKLVQ